MIGHSARFLACLWTVLGCFATGAGESVTGKVIGVTDGDTLEILHNGRPVRIRFHGIDCPERGQPYGDRARQFTSAAAFGEVVRVDVTGRDRYGRTVGTVILPDGRNLNHALVAEGLAWWYRTYAPRDTSLMQAEAGARRAKIGLWSEPSPVPPWEWRGGRGRDRPSTGGSEPSRVPRDTAGEVYVTGTGGKYHAAGCRYLGASRQAVAVRAAVAQGYGACAVCRPTARPAPQTPVQRQPSHLQPAP